LLKTNSLDDSVKSVAELRQPKVTTFVSSRWSLFVYSCDLLFAMLKKS
jgi:hypothetical protein